MTRLNIGIPPDALVDSHLLGEYHEYARIEGMLYARIKKGTVEKLKIPPNFVLKTGHMTFFLDKGKYLERRYDALVAELEKRGFRPKLGFRRRAWDILPEFYRDYQPSARDLSIILERVRQMMPATVRYCRKPFPRREALALLDLSDAILERTSW